jgi:hypothetical protein
MHVRIRIQASTIVMCTNPHRFILPDFPKTTRWLSEEERAIASFRLREHSGTQDEERGPLLKGLWMAITDYKVWILAYEIQIFYLKYSLT